MKKVIILVILALGVGFTSCKKYDQCCKVTAYDNLNDNIYQSEDCETDMSKKEFDEFKYNNKALGNKNYITGFPSRYENVQYSCQ